VSRAAEGTFELLVREALHPGTNFFDVDSYEVTTRAGGLPFRTGAPPVGQATAPPKPPAATASPPIVRFFSPLPLFGSERAKNRESYVIDPGRGETL